MLVPTEEPYTDKYLREEDKHYMQGYDFAAEAVDTAFDNLELETGLETVDKIVDEIKEDIKSQVKDYLEHDRQMNIVSFVDSYSDEELKERGYGA